MFRNVAAKFAVFAFDATTNVPKTGDAANITAYVSKDYGTVTVLADTSATEMDATNAPGYYLFDAAQGETNADFLLVSAKSATANIKVIGAPAGIYTRPTTGWLAPATAGRTLVVDSAGLADANAVKLGPTGAGTALTARDIGASVLLSNGTGTGQLKLASGYVAMTWADIAAPTTTVNLSGTSIVSAGTVGTVSGNVDGSVAVVNGVNTGAIIASSFAAGAIDAAALSADAGTEIAAAVWKDAVAGDFTVASSIGKALYTGNIVPGAAGGHFISGTNAATTITTGLTTTFTGNLTGSVGSVTGAVGSVTGAVGSVTAGVTLAASAVQAIWDALTSVLTTVGSIGKKLSDWVIGSSQTGDSFAVVNSGTFGNSALKTLIDDLPTNAELATSQGTADDATLAAIAALNNLSTAQVNAEVDTALSDVGLTTTVTGRVDAAISTRATPAQVNTEVDTAIADARLDELLAADSDIDGAAPPTVGSVFHELMSKTAGSFTFDQTTDSNEALRDRGDAAWATATGFSTLSQADIRTAVGLGSANLDTQIGDLPTNAELATSQASADDATLAAIAALNNISTAQVNAEVDTALSDVGLTTTITGRIDAAISTRMATYTQPTGFLGAAFPTDPADQSLVIEATDAIIAAIAAVQADLPTHPTKNTALAGFTFPMVLSSDHVSGATGKTVTATRSIDGAAFASCANSVTEISNGFYKIDLAAADLNGNIISFRFNATSCDETKVTIITQAT